MREEAVQLSLLFDVCLPGHAAVEENSDDTEVLHCQFGTRCEL